MIIKLNLHPAGLIQTIKATQAVMESGVKVSVDKKYAHIYNYLNRYFHTDYTLKDAPLVDSEMCHQTPFVRIGKETKSLLYPKSVPAKLLKTWQDRKIPFLFIGHIPDYRKQPLELWKTRAKIEGTNNGRRGIQRFWDEEYYKKLGKAQFVLCPDGGWPWSYRFFEAVMCGATPVVQTEVPCYEGFYYHRWDDENFERKNVQENFQLALERLTIPKEIMLENLYENN